MRIKNLSEILEKNNLPGYRLKQVIKAVYKDAVSGFSEITVIPKELREKLSAELEILSFSTVTVLISPDKKSHKALLELNDHARIETVLISPLSGQWSACVSSQTGCALGCRFCATGASGPGRNLSAEEISDQVLFWKQYLKKNKIEGGLSNVVYMGMGEPFLNYSEVKKSLLNLLDPETYNLAARHLSVSTAGIPDGIRNFARDFPQLNLALSLTSADEKKRSELMPVNQRFGLEKIRSTLDFYLEKTRRKVFLEYILLADVNDSEDDADKLAEFVGAFDRTDLLHVNLIRFNTGAAGLAPSSRERTVKFKHLLLRRKISATIRKSLGDEIKAACGQLAGK